jgi:AAA domain-containing protein
MNESQPKCFDAIGLKKTIPELLQRLSNETNDTSDPCTVMLSMPEAGLDELVEFVAAIDDSYERTVTATADGVVISGQSKDEHVCRLKNAGTGEVISGTRKKHKLQDLHICHLEVEGAVVNEPFATKRHAQAFIRVVRNAHKEDRPIKYILHSGASLKYFHLVAQATGLDVDVYNLLVFPSCEGDPVEGIIPHREFEIEWRSSTSTLVELPEDKPVMLIENLIPEKALTVMAAPSYTGKTHIAIEMGLAMATGTDFLEHFAGPVEPVPVIYHVPELHASLFRSFMQRLGAEERLQGCLENFLIRTLERDVWQLDSPQMVESSRGRYVFLDTFGYFNDGDDSASYTQAISFARKINNLIRQGCLGVCGLYHPPKYSKSKKETGNMMTLENQILGSAGYGGVLRSCLGMRNLHEDSNKGLWVYVQGLKNPGLEGPFQIEGVPLKLVKKPGESLYLSELLKDGGSKREQAMSMMTEGRKRDEICKTLNISSKTLSKWKQEVIFDTNTGDENNDHAE